MSEQLRETGNPEGMGTLLALATTEAERILNERPDVLTNYAKGDAQISRAYVACYIDPAGYVLDTQFRMSKETPTNGSAATYTFEGFGKLGEGDLNLSYSWQAGGECMNVRFAIDGTTGDTTATEKMALRELTLLCNGRPYDPYSEVCITSLSNLRQRMVRKGLLVKLGMKVGWYF